jgi:hypothetical protein
MILYIIFLWLLLILLSYLFPVQSYVSSVLHYLGFRRILVNWYQCSCDYDLQVPSKPRHTTRKLMLGFPTVLVKAWFNCGVVIMIIGVCLTPVLLLGYLMHTLMVIHSIVATASANSHGQRRLSEVLSAGSMFSIQPLIPGVTLRDEYIINFLVLMLLAGIIHEAGHSLAAYYEQIKIEAVGLSLTVCIPTINVAMDEDAFRVLTSISKLRIISAGIWHNLLAALISGFLLYASPALLTSTIFDTGGGAVITRISPEASFLTRFTKAGPLRVGDKIVAIENMNVSSPVDANSIIRSATNLDHSDGHDKPFHILALNQYIDLFSLRDEVEAFRLNEHLSEHPIDAKPIVQGPGRCYDSHQISSDHACCSSLFADSLYLGSHRNYPSQHHHCMYTSANPRKDLSSDSSSTNHRIDSKSLTCLDFDSYWLLMNQGSEYCKASSDCKSSHTCIHPLSVFDQVDMRLSIYSTSSTSLQSSFYTGDPRELIAETNLALSSYSLKPWMAQYAESMRADDMEQRSILWILSFLLLLPDRLHFNLWLFQQV